MTWNLWWHFGPWAERQPSIRAELKKQQADIVLLQEVWSDGEQDQAVELAEELGFYHVRTTTEGGAPQKFGNAILSRWPITQSAMLTLPAEDGSPSHRSCLLATIAAPAGPQIFVVTHLAWQYDAGPLRVRQLQAIVEFIVEHRSDDPEAAPVVFAGDLNSVPDSDEVRRLTGVAAPFSPGLVFTDCWAAVGEGHGHTWVKSNPHAKDALWPRRRLDYVMVAWPRPKPLANPLSAKLAGTEAYDGMVPSDHYAVVVELDDRQTLEHG